MNLSMTPYIDVLLIGAVLSSTLAILTYRRREASAENTTGALLLLACTLWALGSVLEMVSFNPTGKLFWDGVQHAGILILPTGWVVYILQYTRNEKWITRSKLILISIIPLAFFILILTNRFHNLFWTKVFVNETIPNLEVDHVNGPGFWIFVLHSYLLLGYGLFLLLQMLVRLRHISRWQARLLQLAVLTPWVINTLDMVGIELIPQINNTTLAIAITVPVIVWGMRRVWLGDIIPVARGSVIDSMSDVVIVLDTLQRIVDLNPAAASLIGRSSSEIIGDPIEEVWSEWSTLAESIPIDDEGVREVSLPEGEEKRIFDMRVSSVTDWRDRVVSRVIVLRDISDRMRSEAKIRESEERYRLLAENSTDIIARHDPDGVCLYVSPTCQTLIGYAPENMVGRKIYGLIHPNDIEGFMEGRDKLLSGPDIHTSSFRLRRKDGEYIWVEMTGRGIFHSDVVESPKEIISVTRNISERKQAEKALATERERLAVTLRSIGDGVIALNPAGRVVLANPVAETQLEILAKAGVGDILTHLGEQPLEGLLAATPQGKTYHELTLEGPPRRSFEIGAQPMEAGPEAGGWVLVVRDITTERETQRRVQLQERMAAVGQLAAGIAHDFNNILGAVILYSEMILQSPDLSPKNRERLATIYQQAEQAAALTRQILDYSRRTVMDQAPMDLGLFLKDVMKLLSRTIPEEIKLRLECDDDNYVVNADPARIQQILMNLALNARDAMPNGGELCFELSLLPVTPHEPPPFRDMTPGAWLRLAVSDTGTGIEPDVLPHIFEPFYTTKGPGDGSGLGLAQVYGIVKQHDGYIDVRSQVGVGTTFVIYIPAIEVPEWSSVTALANILVEGSGETVLVVEDDLGTQVAIRDILEILDYQVLIASNGREALNIIDKQNSTIDLVLSDLVMPEMGGVELYQQLLERNGEAKIVFMTGYPLGTETRELLDQKEVTWLQKPLRSDMLAQKIRDVLEEQD